MNLSTAHRFVVVFLLLLGVSCRGPEQPYEVIAPQAANLRAQFNQDAGTTRILLLPAPT